MPDDRATTETDQQSDQAASVVADLWSSWFPISITVTTVADQTYTLFRGLDQQPWVHLAYGRQTAEETAHIAAEFAERRRETQAATQQWADAKNRAQALLRSVLTDEQWRQWTYERHFDVVGSDGVTYRIARGVAGNVATFHDNGAVAVRYCAHPELWDSAANARIPNADVHVAQALALRTDAAAFLAVANVHGRWAADGTQLYDDE